MDRKTEINTNGKVIQKLIMPKICCELHK